MISEALYRLLNESVLKLVLIIRWHVNEPGNKDWLVDKELCFIRRQQLKQKHKSRPSIKITTCFSNYVNFSGGYCTADYFTFTIFKLTNVIILSAGYFL